MELEQFRRLLQKIEPGSRLLRAWPMTGGVSAQVTALEVERSDGQMKSMIVRRHGAIDLKHNPQIAADEFRLLQILQTAGLAAPAPYYLDQSCEIFPTPSIAIDYIEGTTDFAPVALDECILQLATHLSRIHSVDGSKQDLSFLPNQEALLTTKLRERPARLDDSLDEGRIRDTLEAAWPLPQHNPSVLLHGDYWPGNTIWKDRHLVAVIDWEDAKVGDPLADLANSRLELVWAFGIEAMHAFTRHYTSMAAINCTNLPYWDLCAALRPAFRIAEWAGDAATERRMREGHTLFIAQAYQTLAR